MAPAEGHEKCGPNFPTPTGYSCNNAAFTYDGDLYGVQIDHLLVGDNFNPGVGFLRREDFRRTFVATQFSPRPQSIRAIRQFTWGANLDYIENGAGQVETRTGQLKFSTELENSDRVNVDFMQNYELLVEPFEITPDITIPPGGYQFGDLYLSYFMGATAEGLWNGVRPARRVL